MDLYGLEKICNLIKSRIKKDYYKNIAFKRQSCIMN